MTRLTRSLEKPLTRRFQARSHFRKSCVPGRTAVEPNARRAGNVTRPSHGTDTARADRASHHDKHLGREDLGCAETKEKPRRPRRRQSEVAGGRRGKTPADGL